MDDMTCFGRIAALSLILICDAGAFESADQATPLDPNRLEINQSPLIDMGDQLYGWQGFDHEWLRFIILEEHGRTPHRISKLHNYIDMANKQFHFAQSTGVDGNYMRPTGYYANIKSDSWQVQQGSVSLSWTDELVDSAYPVADNPIRSQLQIPVHQVAYQDNVHVNLQGIKLDLNCDDNKQPASLPCNSDGMWPYVFHIELGKCRSRENTLLCDLSVTINRAWSPNKGGFQLAPLINEIKPLNSYLDYRLEIFYSLISSPPKDLAAQPTEEHHIAGHIHQKQPHTANIKHSVLPNAYQASVTLIKGFSFRLNRPESVKPIWTLLGSDTGHRGRYIAKLGFSVRDTDNNPADGDYGYEYRMGLWSPITVVDSDLEMTLTTQTLLLSEQRTQTPSKQVSGRLCINSTDQAPAFSRWELCDLTHWLARWIYGGQERLSDAIDIGSES